MLNLSDLAAMVAVVNEGTLQAAAEKLHKTQPAISQAIKRLESSLELKIFDRSGYRFILTDAGNAFYLTAQELLKQSTHVEQFAKQLASGQEESYRICAHCIIPFERYSGVITELAQRFPDTHIATLEDSFNGPIAQLQEDLVDLAIVCGSTSSPTLQQYQSIRLGELETVNVIHPELLNKLPDSVDQVAFDDALSAIRRLVVAPTRPSDPYDYRVKPNGRFWSVADTKSQLDLLVASQGWGQVALSMVQEQINNGLLAVLPTTRLSRSANMHYWAIRKPGREVGQVGAECWQFFLEMAAKSS